MFKRYCATTKSDKRAYQTVIPYAKKTIWFVGIALLSLCLEALGMPYPWFTGPLLNKGAIVVNQGVWDLFPEGTTFKYPGERLWRGSGQSVYGITNQFQIQLIPVYNYMTNNVVSSQGVGDTPFEVGFQLFRQADHPGFPDLKIDIFDLVPFGRYDNLNPDKQGIDGLGQGQNQVELVINTQYISLPHPDHELYTYFSIGYGWFQSVHLSGFNVYGGGFGTDGVLSNGIEFNMDMAFELALTQHWVGVFEFNYLYDSPETFRGNPGVDSNGNPATVFKRKINRWSLAPAIEYNFAPNLGIIFGPWFSVSGDPVNKFVSIQLALNYVTQNSEPAKPTTRYPFYNLRQTLAKLI